MAENIEGPDLEDLVAEGMSEKELQGYWGRVRSPQFVETRAVTAKYVAESIIENAHGSSVIDLACGDGRMIGAFKNKFDRVVGADGSDVQIENAKKKHPDVEFHHTLIEDLEIDEKFDTVLLVNVLEHVKDPVEVISKAKSFMKDDGIMLVHVPNCRAINRRLALKMGTIEGLTELSPYDLKCTGHRRYYEMSTIRADDMEAAGLTIDKTGGVFFRMLSFAQFDWLLTEGPWEEGGFGWGRVGAEKEKNWRDEFCRACYEIGKEYPEDCNVIFLRGHK